MHCENIFLSLAYKMSLREIIRFTEPMCADTRLLLIPSRDYKKKKKIVQKQNYF